MKILVTGGSGKLGVALKRVFKNAYFPTHKELDICNFENIKRVFDKVKPRIIIHTAALTDVRMAESDNDLAWKTNYLGTQNLIKASENLRTKPYFIYISTACVFSGSDGPYFEDSIPNPKNFYSLTKLLGEAAVNSSLLKNKLTVRTNFVSKFPWPHKKAFNDRFANYLFADDVAKAIYEVINFKKTGIIHVAGDKKLSMFDVAKITTPGIKQMSISNYSGPELTMDMCLESKNWKRYQISEYP